ncbi:hypothetical protein [Sphingomonas oleivorans]|nr:hypothetical protein [Sphingomonas oleivorans]
MTEVTALAALYGICGAVGAGVTWLAITLLDGLLEDFRSMLGDDHGDNR